MLLVLGWIALSVVMGLAASKLGRSGFGWAVLALFISPLPAGLLLLLLPCRAAFEARYIHEGIAFQLVGRRQVQAMIDGARIRFASLEQFQLAVAVRKRAASPVDSLRS
jgi:hypothetical protein